MRETRADNAQSVALALLLHALLFALVFIGLQWTRRNAEPAGGGPPSSARGPIAAIRFNLDSRHLFFAFSGCLCLCLGLTSNRRCCCSSFFSSSDLLFGAFDIYI